MFKSRGADAANVVESGPQNVGAQRSRNFRGDMRGKFRGNNPLIPAFGLTTAEWNAIAAEALTEHQDAERLTDKEMALKIGSNFRTYENYAAGKTSPSGLHLLRCIAVIPEFRAAVEEVCALQRELDPMAEKALSDVVNAAMRFVDLRDRKENGDG